MGPWAKVLFVSANGLEGDGWITLIAALASLGLFAVYVRSDRRPRPMWPLLLILLAAGLSALVGIYDWSEIEGVVDTSSEDEPFDVSVSIGWGLVLVTFASISLAMASVVTLLRRAREPAPATPPEPTGEPQAPS
jgi:hypothetical protein